MTFNEAHHSFNPSFAAKYGVNEAILIAHFQYWINHNKRLGRNEKDGKTWTYQTRKEIAAHFSYWSEDQVRRITDSLVEKGVLVKGDYNKKKMDKTIWYAFANEEMFTIGKSAKSSGKSASRSGESAKAIPHTIPNTKTDKKETNKESRGEAHGRSAPLSEHAFRLVDLLISKILDLDEKFRQPNRDAWAKHLQLMHDRDGRSWDEIEELIHFAHDDNFWCKNILSTQKLRTKATCLLAKMRRKPEKYVDPFRIDRRTKNIDGTPVDSPYDGMF